MGKHVRNHARTAMSQKSLLNGKTNNGHTSSDRASSTLSHIISKAEKSHIIKILKTTKGNKTKAAEILGISRKTLWEKIKSYDITA
jgi:two-component system response regulator AtoC